MPASFFPRAIDTHRPEETSDWSGGKTVVWSGVPYRLLGALTRGGMAEIFLASPRESAAGRSPLVVFKRLRAGGAHERAVLQMFEHEAQVALRMDHPNVAAHFGAEHAEGRPFLVLEYIEGQTLAGLFNAAVRRGARLDDRLALYLGTQIARGLHHAHEVVDEVGDPLEIVHRDTCPRNVLVGYDGAIKLIDFGIARSRLSAHQVEVGVVKGKPNYMAPEQATGRPVDRRADVFALGVVLWELCAGQRFSGNSAPAGRRYRLPYAPVPRLADVRPDIDPDIDAVVARAMELDPARRFPTADALRAALLAVLGGEGDLRGQLGRLMSTVFADAREEMQRRVEEPIVERSGEVPVVRGGP